MKISLQFYNRSEGQQPKNNKTKLLKSKLDRRNNFLKFFKIKKIIAYIKFLKNLIFLDFFPSFIIPFPFFN